MRERYAAAPKNWQQYNRRLRGLFYSRDLDGNGRVIKMGGDLKMQSDWPIPKETEFRTVTQCGHEASKGSDRWRCECNC